MHGASKALRYDDKCKGPSKRPNTEYFRNADRTGYDSIVYKGTSKVPYLYTNKEASKASYYTDRHQMGRSLHTARPIV